MTALETSTHEGEEKVSLPPSVQINTLSDKFKAAMESSPAEAATKAREEAAAKPEPKVEPKADKPEPKPQGKADKKEEKPSKIPHEHFANVERQRDEFKTKWEQADKQAKEWEGKIKEVEAKIPKDYDELKQKAERYSELEKKVFVENSPEFKRAFDEKISARIEEVKELVGPEHAKTIADIMAMPPSSRRDAELEKLTEEMSAFKQQTFTSAYREVRQLQKERASELAKAGEAYKQLLQSRTEYDTKSKLEVRESVDRSVKLALSEAQKKIIHFQRIDGNDEHNVRVNENERLLHELATDDPTPEHRTKLALWAVRGVRSVEEHRLKDALIQKLQQELTDIQGASPSAAGGGKPKSGEKKMTPYEKYQKAMDEGIPLKES